MLGRFCSAELMASELAAADPDSLSLEPHCLRTDGASGIDWNAHGEIAVTYRSADAYMFDSTSLPTRKENYSAETDTNYIRKFVGHANRSGLFYIVPSILFPLLHTGRRQFSSARGDPVFSHKLLRSLCCCICIFISSCTRPFLQRCL